MATVVLWIWLASGAVFAQGTYTAQHCIDASRSLIQTAEVVRTQCIETRGA